MIRTCSAREVRVEVEKILKFKPQLHEFYIIAQFALLYSSTSLPSDRTKPKLSASAFDPCQHH
jgi:hypothetical protein